MVEPSHTPLGRYIDLAAYPPDELVELIGELTILFGRLEYMVLLAIKRKSGLPIDRALELYKDYTLGAKGTGKTPCKRAGEMCRDFGSPPGLMSYAPEIEGLWQLCAEIQELTTERNRLFQ